MIRALPHYILGAAVLLLCHYSAYATTLVAHKASGLEKPENTLEAFKHSLTLDVDAIEIDLHISKDKQFVLAHDPVLNNKNCLAKNDKRRLIISQYNAADIQQLKCKTHTGEAFNIPTLDQVLSAYANSDKSKQLYIELKVWDKLIHNKPINKGLDSSTFYFDDSTITHLIYSKLRQYQLNKHIVLISFSRSLLLHLQANKSPNEAFQYGLLFKGEYAPKRLYLVSLFLPDSCIELCWWPNWKNAKKWLEQHNIDFFIPNFPQLNNALFKRGYKKHIVKTQPNFKTAAWTLNTSKEWQDAKQYEFNAIITDLPSQYRQEHTKPIK